MAYIRQTDERDATGIVATVYEAARQRAGHVANIIRVMSGDGPTLQASIQFYIALMKSPSALNRARREMLAAVVANANDCFY